METHFNPLQMHFCMKCKQEAECLSWMQKGKLESGKARSGTGRRVKGGSMKLVSGKYESGKREAVSG